MSENFDIFGKLHDLCKNYRKPDLQKEDDNIEDLQSDSSSNNVPNSTPKKRKRKMLNSVVQSTYDHSPQSSKSEEYFDFSPDVATGSRTTRSKKSIDLAELPMKNVKKTQKSNSLNVQNSENTINEGSLGTDDSILEFLTNNDTSTNVSLDNSCDETTLRIVKGRGRGRGRGKGRGRGRGSQSSVMRARRSYMSKKAADCNIVDFVDLSENPLANNNNVINLDSDDEHDDVAQRLEKSHLDSSFDDANPELFVKIIWNEKTETFTLRKYQKFSHIYEILAKRENTSMENLAFNIESKIILPSDTPDSIGYKITQFIRGRVLQSELKINSFSTKSNVPKKDANSITLKVQSAKWKHPKLIVVQNTEKLRILYIKISEEVNTSINNIKLSFDGFTIDYNSTASDLGMENNDIVDLKITE